MTANVGTVMGKWINLKYSSYENKGSTFPPTGRKVTYFSKALKTLFSPDSAVTAQGTYPNKVMNQRDLKYKNPHGGTVHVPETTTGSQPS